MSPYAGDFARQDIHGAQHLRAYLVYLEGGGEAVTRQKFRQRTVLTAVLAYQLLPETILILLLAGLKNDSHRGVWIYKSDQHPAFPHIYVVMVCPLAVYERRQHPESKLIPDKMALEYEPALLNDHPGIRNGGDNPCHILARLAPAVEYNLHKFSNDAI